MNELIISNANSRPKGTEKDKKKTQTNVVLQPRDKEILHLIYEQQFLTFEQIKDVFFKKAWPQQARARLLKLERSEFVRKAQSPSLGQASVVKLTHIGVRYCDQTRAVKIPYNHRIDHGCALHDKLVTDVSIKLKNWVPSSSWFPERLFKAGKCDYTPDGMLVYNNGNKLLNCAVELELNIKERDRYRDVLSSVEHDNDIDWCLYVTKDEAGFNRLKNIFFNYLKSLARKIGLVTLQDLIAGYPKFHFIDGPRQIFIGPEIDSKVNYDHTPQ